MSCELNAPGDLLFRFYTPRVFAVIIVLSAEPQSADTQSDCAVVVWSDAQDVKIMACYGVITDELRTERSW